MKKKHLLFAAIPAVAVLGMANPAAAAVVSWGGNGTDSITECADGVDPYLHWILTKGGPGALGEGTLSINGGAPVDGFYPGGGDGALHFLTDFIDPEDIDTATATFDRSAARNSLLTISGGCTDGEDPPSES
jgi:hypothetical protein